MVEQGEVVTAYRVRRLQEVPEFPGCTADGKTYQQALTNVEIIIQEWIETARERKRPIPEPKGRLLYV